MVNHLHQTNRLDDIVGGALRRSENYIAHRKGNNVKSQRSRHYMTAGLVHVVLLVYLL